MFLTSKQWQKVDLLMQLSCETCNKLRNLRLASIKIYALVTFQSNGLFLVNNVHL